MIEASHHIADAGRNNWVEQFLPLGLQPYAQLMRLDRPIGWRLLLLPCWWGLFLAQISRGGGMPNLWFAFLFFLGAIIMRGAGCTLNDIIDRKFDALVARTRSRPIPSGRVSVKRAFVFLAAQSLLGLVILLQFNPYTIMLGARLLAPFLTEATAADLLEAATDKTKAEIEQLIAERYPRPDVPARVQLLGSPSATQPPPVSTTGTLCIPREHAPGHVGTCPSSTDPEGQVSTMATLCTPREHAPAHVEAHMGPLPERDRSSLKPLALQKFALQCTINQSTHDKLRHAQELLSHQVPAGDLAMLLDRLLDAAIPRLEQRKFAASERPLKCAPRASGRRAARRSTTATRHIPAHVKRAVWERDQGQCTFVSESGRQCSARSR